MLAKHFTISMVVYAPMMSHITRENLSQATAVHSDRFTNFYCRTYIGRACTGKTTSITIRMTLRVSR